MKKIKLSICSTESEVKDDSLQSFKAAASHSRDYLKQAEELKAINKFQALKSLLHVNLVTQAGHCPSGYQTGKKKG